MSDCLLALNSREEKIVGKDSSDGYDLLDKTMKWNADFLLRNYFMMNLIEYIVLLRFQTGVRYKGQK